MALVAGARLGPYEVPGPLGAGGMGEVYRARDTRLGSNPTPIIQAWRFSNAWQRLLLRA